MTDILRFNFCTVHIYDTYLIVEIDAGIHISSTHIDLLNNVVDTYFRNKPFVFISKRTFSYVVEPTAYSETHEIENLVGFAVVGKKMEDNKDFGLLKGFTQKPFKYFKTVEEAITWAKELIKE